MFGLDYYTASFWGLLLVLATWQLQWFVASSSKAKRPGAVPGKLDPALSHGDFVFRAHRCFQNSLENVPLLLGIALLAIMLGTPVRWTAILIWTFALARLGHMLLYYKIATERNPSPRSWFFLLGLAAQLGLLGLCAASLLQR